MGSAFIDDADSVSIEHTDSVSCIVNILHNMGGLVNIILQFIPIL